MLQEQQRGANGRGRERREIEDGDVGGREGRG